jgi:hypothetical protein
MAKEVAAGFVGGVAGGLVGAGLLRVAAPQVKIRSSKEVIGSRSLDAGESVELKSETFYNFAIILFHGNGEAWIRLEVTKNGSTEHVYGNEIAIEVLANESIAIRAVNADPNNPRNTPTIEIVSITW